MGLLLLLLLLLILGRRDWVGYKRELLAQDRQTDRQRQRKGGSAGLFSSSGCTRTCIRVRCSYRYSYSSFLLSSNIYLAICFPPAILPLLILPLAAAAAAVPSSSSLLLFLRSCSNQIPIFILVHIICFLLLLCTVSCCWLLRLCPSPNSPHLA